jgi:serine/threonine-protein kinase RsbT
MSMETTGTGLASRGSLPLLRDVDVVLCRQQIRRNTTELGFTVLGQTMLVTAASELARNTIIHGGGGGFSWEVVYDGTRPGMRLSFEDAGPGIADIARAMTNGWTSGKGLGLGLPGAKRLVHEFDVRSTGAGTCVVITRWK